MEVLPPIESLRIRLNDVHAGEASLLHLSPPGTGERRSLPQRCIRPCQNNVLVEVISMKTSSPRVLGKPLKIKIGPPRMKDHASVFVANISSLRRVVEEVFLS